MKLKLLLEDKLEQLIKLQAYVGEYNVSCEVELIDDDLVALMHTSTRYVVDDKMLAALQTAKGAYDYARNVIVGRFELGEPVIAKDVHYAYSYACDVIKGKFELGESKILKSIYAEDYKLLLRPKQ
jgi:hypothetical protein